jgi:serine/threonine protein kinase
MGSPEVHRMPELLVGRYVVGERIAVGGMGEVRAGFDPRLDRQVAVKFLHTHVAGDDRARRRFDVEARAAARLLHPNVVTVYDSGEDGGVPFLVMERLPGRTLRDELADGPLTAPRARAVALDILAALGAAHDAGVLHRDIKPGNVMLAEDGHVKVTDFGIAQLLEDPERTLTGDLLATPAYLAPERFTGAPATPRSDLYAVGVVLYEMLSGTRPYAERAQAAIHDAARRRVTPPRPACVDVPPVFADAVARAMDPDPDRRFASAADMASALMVADDRTVSAPSTTVPVTDATMQIETPTAALDDRVTREVTVPARSRTRRTGRGVVAAAVVAVALIAVAIGFALRSDDDPQPPSDATTTPVAASVAPPTPTLVELPAPLARSIDQLEELTTR